MTDTKLADQLYAAKLAAASRGHHASGPPDCECGKRFDSHAELDAHLLDEAH